MPAFSVAVMLGRILGNREEEIEAASEAVSRALAHPVMRRAAASFRIGLCHRETPLLHRDPSGQLIEGVPDLTFRERPDAPWTIVDFKTDARVDLGQEEYRRQVGIYVEALRAATGLPAEGILLYV